tara:strand:- start:388 stop:612 length:225 start_codon:yes stop_codon:yes gene_type:complete
MVKSNDFNTNGAKIMTNKMKRMVIDFTAVFFFLKTGSFNQRQMNGDIVMVDNKNEFPNVFLMLSSSTNLKLLQA